MFLDFNEPLSIPSGEKKNQKIAVSEESLAMLMSMGFNQDQATKALRMTVRAYVELVRLIFLQQMYLII